MNTNWREYAAAHQNSSVSIGIEKTLHYIASKARRPGVVASVDLDMDYPIADCYGESEFRFYIEYLVENEMVKGYLGSQSDEVTGYSPTIKGWQAVSPRVAQGGQPGTCFVAMWFDPSLTDAYELGIAMAVKDCGFKAFRVDRKEHNNQITDEIIAGIRSAEFMVADFTGHRTGVYYEAGFARGLGRDVIYCCREDDFKRRHFDLHVMNHIVWTDPENLRVQLARRIKSTILPKA